jgi:hypothetical protein
MSHNLSLYDPTTKDSKSLRQTPTWGTRICLIPANDRTDNILARYSVWLDQIAYECNNAKDMRDILADNKDHIQDIKSWLKKHPNAKFGSS